MWISAEIQTQILFSINAMKAATQSLILCRSNQEWQKNKHQDLTGKQASEARAIEECLQSLIRNFLMQELEGTLSTGAFHMPERLLEIPSFVHKGIDGQRCISHCSDPSCGCWDISADTKPRAGRTGTTPFPWANGEESGRGNRWQIWLLNGDLGGQGVFELCVAFSSVVVVKRKLGTRDPLFCVFAFYWIIFSTVCLSSQHE